ncbi:MAG: hypothetical protein ACJAVS_001689 [Paracoccaceae bacterium]|jgi:hypothetical protein
MTRFDENSFDLSPEAIRQAIAIGRTERSMIVHRALARIAAWLRPAPRPCAGMPAGCAA